MSDEESNTPSSQEDDSEPEVFMCRKCNDGKHYSASDKDEHRKMHKDEEVKKRDKRRTRGRESLDRSVFEAVSSPTPKRRNRERKRSPTKKKRRSTKVCNEVPEDLKRKLRGS